jgi:ribose transport system substrate-binding protein
MIVIAPTATASATTTKVTLAFDQGYCGNTWRASMDSTYSHEINLLEKQGQVASSTFLCADNSVSTQISQVGDMILDHPSVIVLDPNSTTALNGVIAKAKAAGIPVLITDSGPVTSTIPYQLNTDNWDTMYVQGQYIAQRLHGSGNVLEVRGIPGLANEQSFHEALLAAFKPYPKIHIVASVWGQWDDAVAETKSAAIISSLPTINAVACQGGSYGVIEAFEAAGRPIPVIGGDNRGTFLHWWANEQKKNGYETLSYMTSPGIGAASAWFGEVFGNCF